MSRVVKWLLFVWFSFFGLLHSEPSPGNSHLIQVLECPCEHEDDRMPGSGVPFIITVTIKVTNVEPQPRAMRVMISGWRPCLCNRRDPCVGGRVRRETGDGEDTDLTAGRSTVNVLSLPAGE